MTKIKNPYSGVSVPDPQYYLFGTKSSRYQAELNQYNHLMSERAWDAQLALMADERAYQESMYNKYNSPSAQVAQMREAGLNPDLHNISPEGFSPSPATPPGSNTPSMSSNETTNLALEFFQFLPLAIKTYQSIKGGFLDLDAKFLGVTEGIDSLARTELAKQLSLEDLNSPEFVPRVSLSHLPKRLQRRIEKQYISYVDDFRNRDFTKGLVYKYKASGETARQEYLGLLSKYGFNVNDEAFVKVLKSFNEVISNASKSKSNYDNNYYSKKDGTALAETENKEVEKRGKVADNDVYADLMSKANELIDSKDKSDKVGGYIMYLLLGLMKSHSVGAIE